MTRGKRPRPWRGGILGRDAATDRRRGVVGELRDALTEADRERVEHALHTGVTLVVDGGGHTRAPVGPVRGSIVAAAALLEIFGASGGDAASLSIASVNGQPAVVGRRVDRVVAVLAVRVRGLRVAEAWLVTNPEKLRHWNSD